MKINFLKDDSGQFHDDNVDDMLKGQFNFKSTPKETIPDTTILDDKKTKNEPSDSSPSFSDPFANPVATGNLDSDESDDKKPILKYLIFTGLAVVLIVAGYFIFTSIDFSSKEVAIPIEEKKDKIVENTNKNTNTNSTNYSADVLKKITDKKNALDLMALIYSKKPEDLNLSQVYLEQNKIFIETLSSNRDGIAKLNMALKNDLPNNRFNVLSNKIRISPSGGYLSLLSTQIPMIKLNSFKEKLDLKSAQTKIQSLAKTSNIQISEINTESGNTIFLRAKGSKQDILKFIKSLNLEIENVSFTRFTLSTADLKALTDNDLMLSARLQIL
jgi:hypothetical protein